MRVYARTSVSGYAHDAHVRARSHTRRGHDQSPRVAPAPGGGGREENQEGGRGTAENGGDSKSRGAFAVNGNNKEKEADGVDNILGSIGATAEEKRVY